MRLQTVLILDSQQHRGGMLEQGLTGQGYHVFRTSRSREASKLLHVLQPHFVVLALEGEGRDFYQSVVLTGQVGSAHCVLLTEPSIQGLRGQDVAVDVKLPSAHLLDEIVRGFSRVGDAVPRPVAPPVAKDTDKTVLHLQPFSMVGQPSPSSSASPASPGAWPDAPPPSVDAARLPSVSSAAPAAAPMLPPSTTGFSQAGAVQNREWNGTLDKLDVARTLAILARQQASGRLELSAGHELRTLWLHHGHVANAHTLLPVASVPMLLVQDGIIEQRDAQLYPEIGMADGARRLLELQKIQPQQAVELEALYVEQALITAFAWRHGSFAFVSGTELGIEDKVSLPLPPLILQGVRQGYDLDRLVMLLGESDRVPQWFANRTPEHFLPLQGTEQRIVEQIDGKRSLAELRQMLRVEERLLYSLVYVLMILGYIRMRETGSLSLPSSPSSSQLSGQTIATPLVEGAASSRQTPVAPYAPSAAGAPIAGNEDAWDNPLPFHPPTDPPLQAAPSYRSMMTPARSAVAPFAVPEQQEERESELPPALLEEVRQNIEAKFAQIMSQNYFQILGLTAEANDGEIRRAYQQLKREFAPEQFVRPILNTMELQLHEIRQVVEEAHDVLSDPQLRVRYMSHLAEDA